MQYVVVVASLFFVVSAVCAVASSDSAPEVNSPLEATSSRMHEDKRGDNWNNLSGMWGKRAGNWNNLSGMWGKRAGNWNNLSGMWGKRAGNWNNLSGMWGKRGWNDLSGAWGKRDTHWNNLKGLWGKRSSQSPYASWEDSSVDEDLVPWRNEGLMNRWVDQ